MSEERLSRIEASLAEIATNMATKADLERFATKADLEAAIAAVRAEMATKADLEAFATKADLEAAIAGVAKNVDVTALGRLVQQLTTDQLALKDQVAIFSAQLNQLVNLVVGFGNVLQRVAEQQLRLSDRVRDLETPEP